jgi:DNA-binding NtrC family response regulator
MKDLRNPKSLQEILAAYERIVLIQALQINGFSRVKAAASLRVSRRYFYSRISALRINLGEIPQASRKVVDAKAGVPSLR